MKEETKKLGNKLKSIDEKPIKNEQVKQSVKEKIDTIKRPFNK